MHNFSSPGFTRTRAFLKGNFSAPIPPPPLFPLTRGGLTFLSENGHFVRVDVRGHDPWRRSPVRKFMRIATELYTRSYRPGNSYPCACVRAPVVDRYSVTRTLQKPTFATYERRSMRIDRGFEREKSRNRARPRTSTTSFASRISFFPLFFLRDAITISKVDKRTCG